MKALALLALCLGSASAFAAQPSEGGVAVAMNAQRSASLLEDAPVTSALALTVGHLVGGGSQGLLHMQEGGRGGRASLSGETRQILGLVLGLLIGFGLGHIVVPDMPGFVLFLVVDVAIIVVSSVFWWTLGVPFFYLALLASHIIQGIDAYSKAGGASIWGEAAPSTEPWRPVVVGGRPLVTYSF